MERLSRRGRTLASLLALAALGPALPTGIPPLGAQPARTELVIAATTDVHGRLRGWDYYANRAEPRNSQAAAATIIDSVRAAHPGRVVLVEAGDILQGNPLLYVAAKVAPPPVHPVIATMNVMQYDAAVLGNHEFNYGVPFLRQAIAKAAFPFVAANVRDAKGAPFVAPYTIVQRQGVRVAIVGGTTPGSMIWDRDHLRAAGLTVSDIVAGVKSAVTSARRGRADVVVALLHSGLDEPVTYDTAATGLPGENVAARVAREIPGLDVVVFGHSHREVVDTVIGNALVIQPRNWAGSVGLAALSLEKQGRRWRVVARRGQRVLVTNHAEKAEVLAASATTHQKTVDWVTRAIGRTSVTWRADSARVVDAPISDFVAEVMRREGKADLAVTSAFSLDATIPTGEITRAQMARLYPYDNTLRVIRISGAQLRDYLEHAARYFRTLNPDGSAPAGGLIDQSIAGYNFDMVSGAAYVIDVTRPVGSRITTLTVKGRAVQPTDSFSLAVNNYRQAGGGNYAMLAGAPVLYQRDTDIRQLLMDELERVQQLDPARYAETNWRLEPAAARAIVYDELRRGRAAEAGGRAPTSGSAAPTPSASVARAGQDTAGALRQAPRAPSRLGTPVAMVNGKPVLRVIAMSDFHAQLSPRIEGNDRAMGGAVALSAALRQAQRECAPPACVSVVVDAGDMFTGTPASDWDGGRPTVAVMNRFHVVAGALGNHEFDFGQDTLRQRIRDLRHAVLAANVRGPDGQRPAWLRADTMVVRNGLRIGIIGAAGTHTPSTASKRKVGALRFLDPVPVYVERARALRAAGAQAIVFVLHDGGRCDGRGCSGGGLSIGERLAKLGADRPDVYVMGHAHVNLTFDLAGMPAVEPTSNGRALAVVDVPVGGGAPAHMEIRSVAASRTENADVAVDSIVRMATARSATKEQQVVATLAAAMTRTEPQGTLGNFVADAMRVIGDGDIGLWNNGGLRADLPAGTVRFGDLHSVTPFGNTLVRVRVRGSDLLRLFEEQIDRGRPNAHISGAVVTYDPARPASQRVVQAVDASGVPIDPNRTYRVVLNDFMWEGDEERRWAQTPVAAEYLAIRDSDALAAYLRRQPQPFRGDDAPRFRSTGEGR